VLLWKKFGGGEILEKTTSVFKKWGRYRVLKEMPAESISGGEVTIPKRAMVKIVGEWQGGSLIVESGHAKLRIWGQDFIDGVALAVKHIKNPTRKMKKARLGMEFLFH